MTARELIVTVLIGTLISALITDAYVSRLKKQDKVIQSTSPYTGVLSKTDAVISVVVVEACYDGIVYLVTSFGSITPKISSDRTFTSCSTATKEAQNADPISR